MKQTNVGTQATPFFSRRPSIRASIICGRGMPWAEQEPTEVEAKVELLRSFRGRFDLGQDFTYGIFDPDESGWQLLGCLSKLTCASGCPPTGRDRAGGGGLMATIFHITTLREWEQAVQRGRHEAQSLATEGFIHCSGGDQVIRVANSIFRGYARTRASSRLCGETVLARGL